MRGDAFVNRSNQRLFWISCCLKETLFDFSIALADLVMHFLRQLFEFLHISFDRVGEIVEIERQQVRIGQTHYRRAAGLGQSAAVDEISVTKMRVPVKIVIDGVVDAPAIFSAKTNIQ